MSQPKIITSAFRSPISATSPAPTLYLTIPQGYCLAPRRRSRPVSRQSRRYATRCRTHPRLTPSQSAIGSRTRSGDRPGAPSRRAGCLTARYHGDGFVLCDCDPFHPDPRETPPCFVTDSPLSSPPPPLVAPWPHADIHRQRHPRPQSARRVPFRQPGGRPSPRPTLRPQPRRPQPRRPQPPPQAALLRRPPRRPRDRRPRPPAPRAPGVPVL